jgi:hypothetical protein
MWILQWFYRSGNRTHESYSGFIDRATDVVEQPLVLQAKRPTIIEQHIHFIIKPAPGNRATGNDLRIWGLGFHYSPAEMIWNPYSQAV